MDKKTIYAIVAVVIIIIVAAAAVVVLSDDDDDKGKDNNGGNGGNDTPKTVDVTKVSVSDAELKVFGNVNGDQKIDSTDVSLMQKLISGNVSASDYPMADANQDGKIDNQDLGIINSIIAGDKTTIYHINYHDTNKTGTRSEEIVSTQFPITSAIVTGASNDLLLLFMLGITDEIKGASYATSTDKALFGSTYMNESKTVNLGTNTGTIAFEDGKVGSSNVIAEQHVTAIITDWKQSYTTNESTFENAGIDVVRVDAGATDVEAIKHCALLLGLLFQKTDRAQTYVSLCVPVLDYVSDAIKNVEKVPAVASSMSGMISSANSDYTQMIEAGGAVFGASNVDFGSKTSVKIADYPEFYQSDCKYVIHLRTAINYGSSVADVEKNYKTYCDKFKDWRYAETGQFMVSGTIPVPLRVAYIACALHSDVMDLSKVNDYHQQFVDQLYNGQHYNIASMKFYVAPTSNLADAELKVFGNINGDQTIDSKDVSVIQSLITQGATASAYPMADANQDGVIDSKDVDVLNNIIAGSSTTIYHVNYHDTDKNGTMDMEIVSTQFPITSAITTGSTNTLLLLYMLGITDEIKGASLNSTVDSALFGTTYMDTSKTEKLGTSTMKISFEDGKVGSSNIIAEKHVTALITDWNRSYITNEADFEKAGIDVVRVAAAATSLDEIKHSALLLGLLFQKNIQTQTYLNLCESVLNYVSDTTSSVSKSPAVASVGNGSISSAGSDYQQVLDIAGATFGASNVNFNGSTTAKVADHPEFYTSDCRYVVHINSSMKYSSTKDSVNELYSTATAAFSNWKYADNGQYMISGAIPVVLRIAYAAYALHSDVVDLSKVTEFHQQFVDQLYNGLSFDISSMTWIVTPSA